MSIDHSSKDVQIVPAQATLLPAEKLALTVALSQVTEGRELLPNVAATCVLALARITGKYDYTKEPA